MLLALFLAFVGDVKATVRGDTLTIVGSQTADSIAVGHWTGSFAISAEEPSTTINGSPEPYQIPTVNYRLERMVISLRGGDDGLAMESGGHRNIVDMGQGDDRFSSGDAGPSGLDLDMGPGDDWISYEDSGLRNARITTGPGNDRVRLGYTSFFEHVSISLGSGDDYLTVDGWFYGDYDVVFDGGPGTDSYSQEDTVGDPTLRRFETTSASLWTARTNLRSLLAWAGITGSPDFPRRSRVRPAVPQWLRWSPAPATYAGAPAETR